MFRIYFRILVAAFKTCGLGLIFWRWLLLMPLFIIFTKLTLFCDRIFFAQYRQAQVINPIFIIGNPRSGTSFLHTLLTQTDDFVSFKTWELFFPALTARVIIKPIIDFLIRHQFTQLVPENTGHGLYLDRIEHDEFLFIHQLDTQFLLLLSPLGFDDREYPELRLYDQQPDQRRYQSVKFFAECLKRQIYYKQRNQVIAHIHFSTCRVKTLLEIFPDAKFIYLIRSPYETIPSHLTLEYNVLQHQKRLNNISLSSQNRYFQRRYQYDLELYKYFEQLQEQQQITKENCLILSYQALCLELETSFQKIVDFTNIKPSNELQQTIKQQSKTKYQRLHKIIDLTQFNLDKSQITTDFNFIFQKYNFSNSTKNLTINK